MGKTEQERETEQDDELYALLEKAVSDERLCVNGELIEKTLRRVQDGAERKPARRYFAVLRYACAAAAALLIIVAGGVFLNRGGFPGGTKQSELCPEQDSSGGPSMMLNEVKGDIRIAQEDGEGENAQNNGQSYEIQKAGVDGLANEPGAEDWRPERFEVPEELTEALAAAGYTVSAKEAEYWEHTMADASEDGSVIDRKQEIISALYGAELGEPEAEDRTGGFSPDIPLYAAVKLETGQGTLWILLGERLYLVEDKK